MITVITVKIELPESLKTTNISSSLHGALIELLPPDVQEWLHTQNKYSPLKQRLLFDNHEARWEIVSLHGKLGEVIADIFKELSQIEIKYHQLVADISDYSAKFIDVKELMNSYLIESVPRRMLKIQVLTPVSFKSNGEYQIFPDIKMMFRSIMLNFDTFNEELSVFDKETLDYIADNVKITDYKLRTTRFHLEGVKIPSFIGEINFKISGSLQLQRFINFLFIYGTYSGFGIKTSLGMGKYGIK